MSTKISGKVYLQSINMMVFFLLLSQAMFPAIGTGMCQPKMSVVGREKREAVKMKADIEFGKAHISGILVVKPGGDSLSGVFMNEFGMKGFEFLVLPAGCKLSRMMKKIDKCYIRRALERDFFFIFTQYDVKRTNKQVKVETGDSTPFTVSRYRGKKCKSKLTVENDSVFKMENFALKIKYSFRKLTQNTVPVNPM